MSAVDNFGDKSHTPGETLLLLLSGTSGQSRPSTAKGKKKKHLYYSLYYEVRLLKIKVKDYLLLLSTPEPNV